MTDRERMSDEEVKDLMDAIHAPCHKEIDALKAELREKDERWQESDRLRRGNLAQIASLEAEVARLSGAMEKAYEHVAAKELDALRAAGKDGGE